MSHSAFPLGDGPFASILSPDLEKMPPQRREQWDALFHHFTTARASRPSKRWLETAQKLIDDMGAKYFKNQVIKWLDAATKLPIVDDTAVFDIGGEPTLCTISVYIERELYNLLKGILWSMSMFHDRETLLVISRLADRCFEKIPWQGPAAQAVGNAAVYALTWSRGLEGVGHLTRLKLRVKQESIRGYIEKHIREKAEKLKIPLSRIEELAVLDFGLVNGERTETLGDYKLVLRLAGVGKTELQWIGPNGKKQKSVPAQIKASERLGARLKEIRKLARQIRTASITQRDRIDRLFTSDLTWSEKDLRKYYLEHGLVGPIATRLIWMLDETPAMFRDGEWQDVNGRPLQTTKETRFKLWHPVYSSEEEVRTWRDRIERDEIRQPFKQAHREVYTLTDAEIETRYYSNRMAAHILKQHQFRELAITRGWKYSFLGDFDIGEGGVAIKTLPAHGLEARFWVHGLELEEGADSFTQTGIQLYVVTDRLAFYRLDELPREPVEITSIPPVVLSEILRDLDLFVSVASVGNDPNWQDGGPQEWLTPQHEGYWHSYAFGELIEIAKTRRAVFERILPSLAIRDVAHLEERFLIVKGKKHTYKIHLGSGNVLIADSNRYVCIVPAQSRRKAPQRLFLPFEEDAMISIILSKALLLARDDEITDESILSQL